MVTLEPCADGLVTQLMLSMQGSTGGTSQKRMVSQWPALAGRKISQTVFTLDPCALRPAHVHQYADGLLYVISGIMTFPPRHDAEPHCVSSKMSALPVDQMMKSPYQMIKLLAQRQRRSSTRHCPLADITLKQSTRGR